MGETDPLLRRLERNSLVACGVMTLLAGLIRPDNPQVALGVLAGGGLAALSYRGIKGGIDAFLRALGPEARGGAAWPGRW